MSVRGLMVAALGLVGALMISVPVEAAQLRSWRYQPRENRLTFTTDDQVRPRAQLIFNPTRLVIDLPETTLSDVPEQVQGGRGIRAVRVGQFDSRTTRIVVEFNEGYSIDPQAVRVRGVSPTEWVVQLPEPMRVEAEPTPVSRRESSSRREPPSEVPNRPDEIGSETTGTTQVEGVEITDAGFLIRTRGADPTVELEQDDDELTLAIANAVRSPRLEDDIEVDHYGVETIEIEQIAARTDDPPTVRLTLRLENEREGWRTTISAYGDVLLLPPLGVALGDRPDPRSNAAVAEETPPVRATITSVEVAEQAVQLTADQPLVDAAGEFDRTSGIYRLTLPNAQLGPSVASVLRPRSPLIEQIRLQETNGAVMMVVQAARGVQLGDWVTSAGDRRLEIPLGGRAWVPGMPLPEVMLPTVPTRQATVVIDPGHGGRDPGAIGIGGLREVDVATPVALQVARLLEQQGVRVVMTRRDNRTLELETRVQIAERASADVFVSIHANAISLSRPDVNGIETYHYSDASQRLAATIHASLLEATGSPDRGVRRARFYVIRNTSMPAALVELGFVTGANDAPRLADANYRTLLAQAIARGILQYLQGR